MSKAVFALVIPVVLLVSACPASEVRTSPKALVVRGGSIVLKVPDYNAARSRVMGLAEAHHATLHGEKSEANFAGERHGSITLEMPASELGPMMEDVRRLGKLYSEKVQTSDMTSEYETLDRRIALLGQNESELRGFMNGSRRMRGSDILYVQSRLYQSRVEAADADQSRTDMSRRSARSLLDIAMFEPEPKKTFDWSNWRSTASYRAKGSFLEVTRKATTGMFFGLYFAPIWIPAALILFFAGRKTIRWTRGRLSDVIGSRGSENR